MSAAKPTTHLPLNEADPNDFIMVSNISEKVTNDFKQSELFNPKVGMESHPLSKQVIECVQLIRDWYDVRIKINSTYRNYIPSGAGVVSAASKSPHMMGCGIDFKFLTDSETADNLFLQIRDDFDEKGPLFKSLWELGCRGFGSYDTFIHLDTVKSELYPSFSAKRRSKYEGEMFARWNKMGRLFYKSPSFIVPKVATSSDPVTVVEIPVPTPEPENIVVQKGKEIAGAVRGVFTEFDEEEDAFQDYNRDNWTRIIVLVVGIVTIVGMGYGIFKIIKNG